MELLQLKIFRDIAQERSFVRAGKLNNITQPSVSLHVKHLEEELGVKLFDRTSRRVLLTTEGELLLPPVEDVLRRVADIGNLLAESPDAIKGRLRIAAVNSIGLYALTNLITAFVKSYPQVHICLDCGNSEEIYKLLLQRKIDLGLVAFPTNDSRVQVIPFGSDELILIAPPNHPFTKMKSVTLKQIANADFIAFGEECPTRFFINDAFESKGLSVDPRISNDHVDMLTRSVEASLGVAIVPAIAVQDELRRGSVKQITVRGFNINRNRGILLLKGVPLSVAAERFLEVYEDSVKQSSSV